MGVQFDALFTDDLFFQIGAHAIKMAEKVKEICAAKGYSFYIDSPTNQQFVVLDKQTLERLRKEIAFNIWEWVDDDHAVVRFATAWSTTEEDLQTLAELL